MKNLILRGKLTVNFYGTNFSGICMAHLGFSSSLLKLTARFQANLPASSHACTTWTLTKRLEKKLDGNCTRMLRAILNKSWRQHPTRHQLYGHLPPISKTIQVRRTRHAGHYWRNSDELISDALLWTSLSGICSSIQHLLTNWSDLQTLNRGSRCPFCRVLAFLTATLSNWSGLVSKLTDFLSSPSYIIVPRPPSCVPHNRTHSTRPRSRLYSDIL